MFKILAEIYFQDFDVQYFDIRDLERSIVRCLKASQIFHN